MLEEHRLVTLEKTENDTHDNALRPESLKDFTGQSHLKENLQIFIQAAKERDESLDHILFYGPPGLGKTTLSNIVAKELGVGFRATAAPSITKAGDLAAILTNLQPKDVLFIDEIHRLTPAVEEMLYPAMEDFHLDFIIGEGPSARSIRIDLPPFTLIGATTRTGLITRPLRERFGIPLELRFYEIEELQTIVLRNAKLLQVNITPEGAFEIARRSRGTPRITGRLVRRIRDYAQVAHEDIIDAKVAAFFLEKLNVDHKGFDAIDRRYLKHIAEYYSGGPVGIDTLSAALSEQRDVLEDVIEPYLIQQGMVQRTPRGRMLTNTAFEYLGLPYKELTSEDI